MNEPIRVVHGEGVVSFFLNRPERRNALSLTLLARLSDALSSEIRGDTSAVIVSGVGGSFSAGADLSDLIGTLQDLGMDDAIEEVTLKIRDLPVPVIAAIDGPCLGGAFDLALSCDHRIASRDAFFQVPATRLGLLYNPRSIVVVEGASYEAALKIAQAATGNFASAVAATKQLLNAIDGIDYDPGEWDKQRRELLSSPERRAAVASEKKRRGY